MRSTPLQTLLPRVAFAAFASLVLAVPTNAQPPAASTPGSADRPFAEKVLVREVGIVVELPDTLSARRIAALTPESFLVTEDGTLRPVTKAEPLPGGDAGPWTQVVYVDRPLASPETIALAGVALANRAADLARLGTVELVITDPQPRTLLAATRDVQRIKQALLDVASGARQGATDREKKNPSRNAEPTAATVRRESDRLLSFLAERATGGPHSLFLVADAFELPAEKGAAPETAAAATAVREGSAPDDAREPSSATGSVLAAYGWVTVALPLRKQGLGTEHRELSDIERLREGSGTRQTPNILPSQTPKSTLNYDGVINVFVLPQSAWLHALATDTAGTLVGYEEQLTTAFKSLGRRWHLYYQAPDPADGRLHPVEVKLLPDSTPLRAPRFRRSSTPEALAAAWARGILSGQPNPGALPLTVSANRKAGAATPTLEIVLAVDAYTPASPAPTGPFRLTLAWAGTGDEVTVEHRLLTGTDLSEKGFVRTLALPIPAGGRQLAVVVEDLGHQVVGGSRFDVPGLAPAPTTTP